MHVVAGSVRLEVRALGDGCAIGALTLSQADHASMLAPTPENPETDLSVCTAVCAISPGLLRQLEPSAP